MAAADERTATLIEVVGRAGLLSWNVGWGFDECYEVSLDAVRAPADGELPRVFGRGGVLAVVVLPLLLHVATLARPQLQENWQSIS